MMQQDESSRAGGHELFDDTRARGRSRPRCCAAHGPRVREGAAEATLQPRVVVGLARLQLHLPQQQPDARGVCVRVCANQIQS